MKRDALGRFPAIQSEPTKYWYTQGFFCGDGSIHGKTTTIQLYGVKRSLLPWLDGGDRNADTGCPRKHTLYLMHGRYGKTKMPGVSVGDADKLQWLAGYIDADGCLDRSSGVIRVTSIDVTFMVQLSGLLNELLGVKLRVCMRTTKPTSLMPDGRGGMKEYPRKQCWGLDIPRRHVAALVTMGLQLRRVRTW